MASLTQSELDAVGLDAVAPVLAGMQVPDSLRVAALAFDWDDQSTRSRFGSEVARLIEHDWRSVESAYENLMRSMLTSPVPADVAFRLMNALSLLALHRPKFEALRQEVESIVSDFHAGASPNTLAVRVDYLLSLVPLAPTKFPDTLPRHAWGWEGGDS